ncbi:MAG TPA: AAA family ATPase [Trebonia sp.]|nr:AAA family ATPase [Trebonia sp.]
MTAGAAFVGRGDELARLGTAIAAARAGESRIVLVEGEAGMGKTALLRQALRDGPGLAVAWASGDPAESGLEFGLIGQLLAALPGPASAGADAGWNSVAAGAALLAGISAAEERGPALALVADDLHWSDGPSADALLFCLRRLSADPVVVLLAGRPGELGQLGESWTRLLADPGRVQRVQLTGLSASEVRGLARAGGRDLTAEAAGRLRRHAAGNPLYVSALLAELPDEALRGEHEFLPAPRAYAASVLARLARLGAPARQLVRATGVAGVRCGLRLAAAVAGLPDPAAALDEAVAAGLLEVRAGRGEDELVFTHPLARAAVYEDLSAAERRRLHQAAAGLLAPPATYGHRVAAVAGGLDGALAGELIAAAGAAEETGAVPLAARYLGWAARVDDDPGRGELSLLGAIRHAVTTGDLRGVGDYAAAVAARPPGPWRNYTLSVLAVLRGEFEQAASGLRLLAEAPPTAGDATLWRHCTAILALVSTALGRDEDGREWARRSLAASAGLPLSASFLAVQALAWSLAKTSEITESLRLLADFSPPQPEASAFGAELLTVKGVIRDWSGDYAGAIADLATVVTWQRTGPYTHGITHAYTALAEAEFRSGNWDAAATHIEVALSLGEDLGHHMYLAHAHCVAALLTVLRDGEAAARPHLAAARDAASASPSAEALAYAALAPAHLAWARADWPGVSAALAPLAGSASGTPGNSPNLGLWRYRLAEARLHEGRLDEAGRLLDEAPPPPWGGITGADVARLRALAWQQEGEPEKAAATFATAMPAPGSRSLADGLLALDYGRLLVQLRKRKAAVPVLLTGRAILAGLGAAGLVGDCDRALVAAGVPGAGPGAGAGAGARDGDGDGQAPRPPSRAVRLRALTGREQAVARLAATGLTNRQVAAELYVSVKAVEYHLTSVFAKLGIASRRQLAGALAEAALPPAPP